MIPLHDRLRHVGCQSSRRPKTGSGRKIRHTPLAITACEVQLRLSLIRQYALNHENVPHFVAVRGSRPVPVVLIKKPEYIPPRGRKSVSASVEYPVKNAD
jgi:hypothetical protein